MDASKNVNIIESDLTHFFQQIGWNMIYNLTFDPQPQLDHLIEAFIDMKSWKITVKYAADLLDQFSETIQTQSLENEFESNFLLSISDPFYQELLNLQSYAYHQQIYDFLAGVAYHEVGHSKQCPIDSTNFSTLYKESVPF